MAEPRHTSSSRRPRSARRLRILALGAGVQSSTLLLMSLAGKLPRLDAAIFADTQFEPHVVYQHLARLERAARAAGVPLYRVTAGNLRDDALDPARHHANLPLFVAHPDGTRGMVRRQCTLICTCLGQPLWCDGCDCECLPAAGGCLEAPGTKSDLGRCWRGHGVTLRPWPQRG